MKKITVFLLALSSCYSAVAQYKAVFQTRPIHQTSAFIDEPPNIDEEDIGITYWDLQTNSCIPSRIVAYDDGTIGTAFYYGIDYTAFPDRGTGYNFFNGQNWGPFPGQAVESDRAGNPAYEAFGVDGEIIVAHLSGGNGEGLMFNKRNIKGTGNWTEWNFLGPEGFEDVLWARLAAGGINHSIIHLLCLTKPVANGGSIYEGQDGALLYSRSTDGGENWTPHNVILNELSSEYYPGFEPEKYILKAKENNVAILVGGDWMDLVLLKSTDGGDNWTKTIVWEHPFPNSQGIPTDTFFCNDGFYSFDFDSQGRVHLAFGLKQLAGDMGWWHPYTDGLVYWNENRPTFSNNVNALNPYGHPDSELEDDYSLVGWVLDINNNGEWDVLGEFGEYYSGISSMSQIVIDDSDNPILIFSSITETYNNGIQDYRHIWLRRSNQQGDIWLSFIDLNWTLVMLEENVFPAVSNYQNGHIYVIYQKDYEPGMAVRGDMDPYSENTIRVMDLYWPVGINENKQNDNGIMVFQNSPNPFSKTSIINVKLIKPCYLSLEITNSQGQKVYEIDEGFILSEYHKITLNASLFHAGIYFYTVNVGETRVTNKMVVK